jgi:hypothetical protein
MPARLIAGLDGHVEIEAEWDSIVDTRRAELTSEVAKSVPLSEAIAVS